MIITYNGIEREIQKDGKVKNLTTGGYVKCAVKKNAIKEEAGRKEKLKTLEGTFDEKVEQIVERIKHSMEMGLSREDAVIKERQESCLGPKYWKQIWKRV